MVYNILIKKKRGVSMETAVNLLVMVLMCLIGISSWRGIRGAMSKGNASEFSELESQAATRCFLFGAAGIVVKMVSGCTIYPCTLCPGILLWAVGGFVTIILYKPENDVLPPQKK